MKDSGRKRVVVLGSGWAGFRIARDINIEKYDLTVISPRNHFLFTPLLPSTTVGTLEFRGIIEPIRTARERLNYVQVHAGSLFDST
jgi:NADH dehydrogenase FAD-containing subunit